MKWLRCVMAGVLLAGLAACGGGGGSAGTPITGSDAGAGSSTGTGTGSGSGTGSTGTVVLASDFVFELDKTELIDSGSDKALLTVTALDANRNTLEGAPVTIALDGNGVLTGKSGTSTAADGTLTGNITIGNDKSDRVINATITVNGITKVASVIVSGSQIQVTPVPSTPTPGQQVTLNITTTDANGNAIQNADVTLSGTAGLSQVVRTDLQGRKSITFNAPATEGSYTIVASGLNVSTSKSISVALAGSGAVPDAIGPVSAASLSPQPSTISTNTAGSSTNRAKLSARFLTTGNIGIQNMRVRFEIVPPDLGSGEMISTGDGTVYTDVSGLAEADYIAGTRSSPTNGVVIKACYSPVDFVSATDCPNSVTANLTVAGTPLSINISDDNTLTKGLGGIAYIKQFLVQVNDASGVAVKDAVVSASVDITHYGKGPVWGSPYVLIAIPDITDVYPEFMATVPSPCEHCLQSESYAPAPTERVWCVNEDRNRNGYLDVGEDLNGDGVIEPRKAEIVVSYVSGNKTDENGQLLLQVSYGQNMGGWLAYTLRATTAVEGSEGDAAKAYVTDVLKDDVDNGSFLTPPFGTQACTSAK